MRPPWMRADRKAPQFAYNEMSFFLVKLLQRLKSVRLVLDAQPPDSRPPAEWRGAPGRQGVEKVWPAAFLTLFTKVRIQTSCAPSCNSSSRAGCG